MLNTGASDEQLQELLEDTKLLLAAAQTGDREKIGRELARRQECLDKIIAAGGVVGPRSQEREALIGDILALDKKACRAIRELANKSGNAALSQRRKTAGIMRYSYYQNDDISNVRMIDKRD